MILGIMPLSQLFNFMSLLRLGSEYKTIPINLKVLNALFERGFSANLLLAAGESGSIVSPDDIDVERAAMYRFILKNVETQLPPYEED